MKTTPKFQLCVMNTYFSKYNLLTHLVTIFTQGSYIKEKKNYDCCSNWNRKQMKTHHNVYMNSLIQFKFFDIFIEIDLNYIIVQT